MKKILLIALLLPVGVMAQRIDTTKAKLLVKAWDGERKVYGYVITQRQTDTCIAVGFLTVYKTRFPKGFKLKNYEAILK